jgi:predicted ATPase
MGEVYRAYDTRLQREVAIKVLGRRLLGRPEALQLFEQEARAVSALNHPNIITLYDIGEEPAFPYIVMELVEGKSLREMLSASSSWPLGPLLRVANQVAEGLVAAHERHIVHRDLKPENILVSHDGVAKIVDFGIAQIRMDYGGADVPKGFRGTLGYVSPEALACEPVDARSDQFSFGAILYEMATGAPAFPRSDSLEAMAFAIAEGPRPIAELRPDLPTGFARLVARCLRKSPTGRYASTRELLQELRQMRREAVRPSASRRSVPLPAERTRLIGRSREIEDIQRLVLESKVRLLTLTGAGGTGKTRLALRAASVLEPSFPGGAIYVPLAAITDGGSMVAAIAQTMGATLGGARPPLASLIGELRSANASSLLVLDNFEQLIDAAPMVGELLAACPDLVVIVTSREVLHLYGEHGYSVSALELPDAAQVARLDVLAECPAVALFVERARGANASFRLTAENAATIAKLCAGLDGLPLALELAAAQTRVLSPAAMLGRFEHRLSLLTGGARDLPDRQQTLRRTIDWSHQLLSATEQALFRRLAVFAGGFTVEAAQAVGDPFAKLDVPIEQGVSALVDKSLLQASETEGEPRFAMLQTLGEYAREKLAASGEMDRTLRAHAAYFLVVAEEDSAQGSSFERLEADYDNLRAALDWLTREGNAEWGLRMALALFHFWERGLHLTDGRARFDALLKLEGAHAHASLEARAAFAAGVLAANQWDIERGLPLQEQSLQMFRALGDRRGVVVSLVAVGNQLAGVGEHERARTYLEQSLEGWRELGDREGYARSLSNLAFVARGQARFEEARTLYRQAQAEFERLGDPLSRAWALDHEGDVAREQNEVVSAEALYREALEIFRARGDSWGIASCLADLGGVARVRREHGRAAELYREALASFVALGHYRGIARLLESFACLAGEQNEAERGVQLAAAASVLRHRIGAPPAPANRGELERSVEAMMQRLGALAGRAAWEAGASLTLEEALRAATTQ